MDKKLVQLYVNWNKMYIFFHKDEFTESDLKMFKNIIKYLFQFFKLTTKNFKYDPSSIINDEIATFKLSLFDEFVKSYKFVNSLASETSEVFNQFLSALDRFFDLYEELTENEMRNRDVFVKWYKSAIVSSSDTIRAISEWYN
ncbi:5782_t:CDS:2 [Funneliformis mosseae]|uniref:5782_t:CDS:1 n=1 Tax=Funneliformis mosseae TaxID=27381 RepID=A0A9N8ZAW6_FUNMO|nr:5782_t:CDS:2 [Funneliformis mosseae]